MAEHESGAVWLITGCSSGLGAAIAGVAAARGAQVVATARDPSSIPVPADSCSDRFTRLTLDVTNRTQRDTAVREIIERFGRIDVLVNNAGRMYLGAVEECADDELRAMFDLHVFGPMELVRLVLPFMREQRRGTIVQMSSMGAFLTVPGTSCYTAAKAALEGLSVSLSVEVAPFGVQVLIVEPGNHRTSVFSPDRLSSAKRMPEYAEVVGGIERLFHGRDGTQVGDPERAAEIIVDMVGADDAPLRLPLGADAVETITTAARTLEAEILRWADLARTTAYHAQPSPHCDRA